MPAYEFGCELCGPFVVMRRIAERDMACTCPACGAIAQRMLSLPALSLMPSGPQAETQLAGRTVNTHQHGAGCGCGSPVRLAGTPAGAPAPA